MSHLDQRNYRVVDEHYALIPKADIPRSTFRRVHELKTTAKAGLLIPILVDEVLPGDVHTAQVTLFARLGTLLFPIMDNASVETQFFFVPARILWANWKKFMGEQANPGDSISYTIPQVVVSGQTTAFSAPDFIHLLQDYMGIPIANFPGQTYSVNSLPFRAYNLIYNEWYRDQNVASSRPVNLADSGDLEGDFVCMARAKKHDYFTSVLPAPQRGAQVNLPLGTTAPILGLGVHGAQPQHTGALTSYNETSRLNVTYAAATYGTDAVPNNLAFELDSLTGYPKIYADLSQATAASINALRLAVQTQKLLERDARGGTRYTESLQSHWGVHPQDARLQRPEYIGGGSTPIQTAAIAQTAPTSGTPFAGLGGQATATGQHHYTLVAQEHGYILGLMSLMTRPTYQEGTHRMWTRLTRYDFAWPEFAAIGEQAVRNDELYTQGIPATDAAAFGYQERYAEYRFANSRVSGLFRTKNTGSISQWHLAQSFSALPTLNNTFINESAAPWTRALAAGAAADWQQFIADILFNVRTTRALPAYGVPGSLMGTF